MGLAISTHFLVDMITNDAEGEAWFRDHMKHLAAILAKEGLPPHVEPEVRGPAKARRHVGSFPYSFLHYLRRAYAYVHEDEPLTPLAEGDDPNDDPMVEEANVLLDSHLLCHSDAEGYYVPFDFENIIVDDAIPGGMVGSSQRLFAELVAVAPAIGIELDGTVLSDKVAAALAKEAQTVPYATERLVWLTLYEQARVSIANRTLIVFN
jgi:hypothetical protein